MRSRPLKPLKAPVKSQKETKEISSLTKTTKGEKTYIVTSVFIYIYSYFTVTTFILVQRKEALPPISVQPAQKEEIDVVPDAPDVKIDLPIDQVFISVCRCGQILVLMNSKIFHNLIIFVIIQTYSVSLSSSSTAAGLDFIIGYSYFFVKSSQRSFISTEKDHKEFVKPRFSVPESFFQN